jgi:hypothetical protein
MNWLLGITSTPPTEYKCPVVISHFITTLPFWAVDVVTHRPSVYCRRLSPHSFWTPIGSGIISKLGWRRRNGNWTEIKSVSKTYSFPWVNWSWFHEALFTKKLRVHKLVLKHWTTFIHASALPGYILSPLRLILFRLYHYPAKTQTSRFKADGTARKLATATQPQFPRIIISLRLIAVASLIHMPSP